MKKLKITAAALFLALVSAQGPALAHTALCSCVKNGDGTVTCEGAFSDGSSAAGVPVRVVDSKGKVLVSGKMDEESEFTFKEPKTAYKVVLDAGPGHLVTVDKKDISD